MRGKVFAVWMSLMVLILGIGQLQAATLTIEDVCGSAGETVIVNVLLDNSADGVVAAAQMDILFDTSVFSVTGVAKTDRSSTIDIFMYSETANGITFVVTGIGHEIAAGTGSIGEITVVIDGGAADGSYDWTPSGVIMSDPFMNEYSVTTENGTFQIPCGGPSEGVVLSLNCDDLATGTVYVELDNSSGDTVTAGEMIITFDKGVFSVTNVAKTDRSTLIDLFLFSQQPQGISFVFTGIGHHIFPGTGPIAALSVTGTGTGDWCFEDGSILANPYGVEISHETRCCSESTGIEPVHVDMIPTQYAISQNYPNPFNPTTSFDLSIPSTEWVHAVVYNVMGQKVRELVNGELPSGYYTLTWDGFNDRGVAVTSGMYFLRIKAGTFNKSVKMLLLK